MSQGDSGVRTIQLYNQVELPVLGLGTFKARGTALKAIVSCALSCGIRHIDTATVYKVRHGRTARCWNVCSCSQVFLTRVSLPMQNESEIADALESSDVLREDIFITSKIGPTQVPHLTRAVVFSSMGIFFHYASAVLSIGLQYFGEYVKGTVVHTARDRQSTACMRGGFAASTLGVCRSATHSLAWRGQAGGEQCPSPVKPPLGPISAFRHNLVLLELWSNPPGSARINGAHKIFLLCVTQVKSARNATKRLETWRVLEGFYKSGRCRAIGVSNYEQHHLQELLDSAAVKPMVNQVSFPYFCNLEAVISKLAAQRWSWSCSARQCAPHRSRRHP